MTNNTCSLLYLTAVRQPAVRAALVEAWALGCTPALALAPTTSPHLNTRAAPSPHPSIRPGSSPSAWPYPCTSTRWARTCSTHRTCSLSCSTRSLRSALRRGPRYSHSQYSHSKCSSALQRGARRANAARVSRLSCLQVLLTYPTRYTEDIFFRDAEILFDVGYAEEIGCNVFATRMKLRASV